MYRGAEDLAPWNKGYWNLSLGIDPARLSSFASCKLVGKMTATDGPMAGGMTKAHAITPFIEVNVPIGVADGELSCGQNPLNGGGGVSTRYTGLCPDRFTSYFQPFQGGATGLYDIMDVAPTGEGNTGFVQQTIEGPIAYSINQTMVPGQVNTITGVLTSTDGSDARVDITVDRGVVYYLIAASGPGGVAFSMQDATTENISLVFPGANSVQIQTYAWATCDEFSSYQVDVTID